MFHGFQYMFCFNYFAFIIQKYYHKYSSFFLKYSILQLFHQHFINQQHRIQIVFIYFFVRCMRKFLWGTNKTPIYSIWCYLKITAIATTTFFNFTLKWQLRTANNINYSLHIGSSRNIRITQRYYTTVTKQNSFGYPCNISN